MALSRRVWSAASEEPPDGVHHSTEPRQNGDRFGFLLANRPNEGEGRLRRPSRGVDGADVDVVVLGRLQLDRCGDRPRERRIDDEGEGPGLDRVVLGVDRDHESIRPSLRMAPEVVGQLEMIAGARHPNRRSRRSRAMLDRAGALEELRGLRPLVVSAGRGWAPGFEPRDAGPRSSPDPGPGGPRRLLVADDLELELWCGPLSVGEVVPGLGLVKAGGEVGGMRAAADVDD